MALSSKSFSQCGDPHDQPQKCKFSTGLCPSSLIMGLSSKSFSQYGHPHDRPKKYKFSTGFCLSIVGLSSKSFSQYGHPHGRPKKCKFSTGFCLLKSETLRSKISHAGSSLSDSQVNPSANMVTPMTSQKSATLVLDFAILNRKLCVTNSRMLEPPYGTLK